MADDLPVSRGRTKCTSLVLPFTWGENSETWSVAVAVFAAALVWVGLRLLIRPHHT